MLLNLLELASNKTLEHGPKTRARLAKLQGKTVMLRIQPINQSISVSPQPEGLEFSLETPDHVDVTLSTTIGALIKISRDGLDNADLKAGELEIVGDPIVGQRFAQVIAELDINWESLLAEQLGDAPARAVTYSAEQAKVFFEQARDNTKDLVSTLIKEDLQLVPDKKEVEGFLDDVDTIRADADRLMARIKRIQVSASTTEK